VTNVLTRCEQTVHVRVCVLSSGTGTHGGGATPGRGGGSLVQNGRSSSPTRMVPGSITSAYTPKWTLPRRETRR
jgi:hypothetical protein